MAESERSTHELRASDEERARITNQLHGHCVAGRLSIDELEARLQRAMSAQTVRELTDLVQDLPHLAMTERKAGSNVPRVGLPGIRPFTYRLILRSPVERTRRVALDTLAVALNRAGWELVRQTPNSLEFVRSKRERILIDLEPNGSTETTMIVHGSASRYARARLAKLS